MGINGRNALCDDLDQTASNTYVNIKIPYLFDYKPSDFYTIQNWIELKFGL